MITNENTLLLWYSFKLGSDWKVIVVHRWKLTLKPDCFHLRVDWSDDTLKLSESDHWTPWCDLISSSASLICRLVKAGLLPSSLLWLPILCSSVTVDLHWTLTVLTSDPCLVADLQNGVTLVEAELIFHKLYPQRSVGVLADFASAVCW